MGVPLEVGMRTEQIQKILPHRYPFSFVDKVLERYNPEGESRKGSKVVALKNVTINEYFFVGHFPHRPVVPGVILVEVMAQVGGLAAYREEDPHQSDISIARIKKAKFRVPVRPGDTMIITSEVVYFRQSKVVLESHVEVEGQKVAEAEMMAFIKELKPQ